MGFLDALFNNPDFMRGATLFDASRTASPFTTAATNFAALQSAQQEQDLKKQQAAQNAARSQLEMQQAEASRQQMLRQMQMMEALQKSPLFQRLMGGQIGAQGAGDGTIEATPMSDTGESLPAPITPPIFSQGQQAAAASAAPDLSGVMPAVTQPGQTGLDLTKLTPQQVAVLQKMDPQALANGVSRFLTGKPYSGPQNPPAPQILPGQLPARAPQPTGQGPINPVLDYGALGALMDMAGLKGQGMTEYAKLNQPQIVPAGSSVRDANGNMTFVPDPYKEAERMFNNTMGGQGALPGLSPKDSSAARAKAMDSTVAALEKEGETLKGSPAVLDAINTAKDALARGAFQGPGAGTKRDLAKFLNSNFSWVPGFKPLDEQTVANTDVLASSLAKPLSSLMRQMDSNMTEGQQKKLEATIGTLTTSPDALPRLLAMLQRHTLSGMSRYNRRVDEASANGVPLYTNLKYDLPSADQIMDPTTGRTPSEEAKYQTDQKAKNTVKLPNGWTVRVK